MIVARTPFRVSFSGGGSDLKEFYGRNEYGAVVSTSIDKYMYVMIHNYFHDRIRIKYSKTEDVNHIDEIRHPLVRECLRLVGVKKGIEIASIADVPAGTGLGSSSSFTVCLLHALYAFQGKKVSRKQLAQDACHIEIEVLKEPIGKQDQYAASIGGLNYFRFNKDDTVNIEADICDVKVRRRLEKSLLMFYVGNERKASGILAQQKSNMDYAAHIKNVKKMVSLTEDLKKSLTKGDLSGFGSILNKGWSLKKSLSDNISTPLLDEYYDKALKAGALGGKVLGAGGGGFFLFYCDAAKHRLLRSALRLRELKFTFDEDGSRIVYAER